MTRSIKLQFPQATMAHHDLWRKMHLVVWSAIVISAAAGAQTPSQAVGKNANRGQTKVQAAIKTPAVTTPQPPRTPSDNEFVIGNDDILGINVWQEPDISRVVPVRSDGKISLPLVGELEANGRTPLQLESEISKRLEAYITAPEVTVIVQEIKSQKFNILGQIARPGTYTLLKPMSVLDAIAVAGGFRDFAKMKAIYVLRREPNGKSRRIPFNYKQVIKNKKLDQNIDLEAHDTIVVP